MDRTFADIQVWANACRFSDCRHDSEPGCAVQEAIRQGILDADRLESYRKLERELAHLERKRDPVAMREQKQQNKRATVRYHRYIKKRK